MDDAHTVDFQPQLRLRLPHERVGAIRLSVNAYLEGICTKKMVAYPIATDHVRLMFEVCAEPETSFRDIARYFRW